MMGTMTIQQITRTTAVRILMAVAVGLIGLLGPLASPASACTAFIQETPEGTVVATNLDFLVPADGMVVVNRRGISKQNDRTGIDGNRIKWVSKYGSVTFNLVGVGYVWGGMNEAGLVVTMQEEMSAEYPQPDKRPPFDPSVWFQYILDNYATVEEAIAATHSVRMESAYPRPQHCLLADAKGGSAALEYRDGKLVVYTGKTLPVKAIANMPYARAVKAMERGGAPWWWSNPGRSAERVAIAAKRIQNYNPQTDTNTTAHVGNTLVQVADQYTQWSIIFNIQKRKVWFRTTRKESMKYFKFDDIDFSCGAPALILDIHTDLKGNIGKSFQPYTRAANEKLFRTLIGRIGLHVSEEDTASLMRSIEEQKCAP